MKVILFNTKIIVAMWSLLISMFCSTFHYSFASPTPVEEKIKTGKRLLPMPIAFQDYELTYRDSFDSLDLSLDGFGSHNWYNGLWLETPLPLAGEIKVKKSLLHLLWKKNPLAPKKWTTSVNSMSRDFKKGRMWEYGYFEIRMKWNVVPGAWPAIWLFAPDLAINGAQGKGCEIDIFEGQAATPNVFFGTVHDWKDGKNRQNGGNFKKLNTNFNEFHTYGMLWTPDTISWFIDDKFILSSPTPPLCVKGPLYMILSAQEGVKWTYGNLKGVLDNSKIYMDIDWINVWQLKQRNNGFVGK